MIQQVAIGDIITRSEGDEEMFTVKVITETEFFVIPLARQYEEPVKWEGEFFDTGLTNIVTGIF